MNAYAGGGEMQQQASEQFIHLHDEPIGWAEGIMNKVADSPIGWEGVAAFFALGGATALWWRFHKVIERWVGDIVRRQIEKKKK